MLTLNINMNNIKNLYIKHVMNICKLFPCIPLYGPCKLFYCQPQNKHAICLYTHHTAFYCKRKAHSISKFATIIIASRSV